MKKATATKEEIKKIRKFLRLTQVELASILGTHQMSVSAWERGARKIPKTEQELLEAFEQAEKNYPLIGVEALEVFRQEGFVSALRVLLNAAGGTHDR